MQVVVFRMLRETLIFFLLLAIMALGFVQSMLALDSADTELSDPWGIINILLQALLGSPDFDQTAKNFSPPFGLIIYYAWSFLTIIILLNILIALFGTAYSDIAEDATNQYLCHFSASLIFRDVLTQRLTHRPRRPVRRLQGHQHDPRARLVCLPQPLQPDRGPARRAVRVGAHAKAVHKGVSAASLLIRLHARSPADFPLPF